MMAAHFPHVSDTLQKQQLLFPAGPWLQGAQSSSHVYLYLSGKCSVPGEMYVSCGVQDLLTLQPGVACPGSTGPLEGLW